MTLKIMTDVFIYQFNFLLFNEIIYFFKNSINDKQSKRLLKINLKK